MTFTLRAETELGNATHALEVCNRSTAEFLNDEGQGGEARTAQNQARQGRYGGSFRRIEQSAETCAGSDPRENPRYPRVNRSRIVAAVQTALLIDAIVRQTTVLIAQLSTTSGLRAPLAHVANQVFLDLVTELEGQGVGRKVIADMFGLALRSYQQKVQRLQESATDRGATLWEAILGYIQEHKTVSRPQVLARFANDDGATVRGVLNDLVGSSLVYRTGSGEATVYRAAQAEEVASALEPAGRAAKQAMVWVTVYREGPLTRSALLERVRLPAEEVDAALAALLAEGRVQSAPRSTPPSGARPEPSYRAESCLIPLEQTAGWEAAVLDHFQAMVGAVCAKLALITSPKGGTPQVGGSTYTFDVWPGHPQYEQVTGLLERTRTECGSMWEAVHQHNAQLEKPATFERVTFYFGQNVRPDVSSKE